MGSNITCKVVGNYGISVTLYTLVTWLFFSGIKLCMIYINVLTNSNNNNNIIIVISTLRKHIVISIKITSPFQLQAILTIENVTSIRRGISLLRWTAVDTGATRNKLIQSCIELAGTCRITLYRRSMSCSLLLSLSLSLSRLLIPKRKDKCLM